MKRLNKAGSLIALLVGCSNPTVQNRQPDDQPKKNNICSAVASIPVHKFRVKKGDSPLKFQQKGYISSTADFRFYAPSTQGNNFTKTAYCDPGLTETHLGIPGWNVFLDLNDINTSKEGPSNSIRVAEKRIFHPGKTVLVTPDYQGWNDRGITTDEGRDLGKVGTVDFTIEPFTPAFPDFGTNRRITSYQPRFEIGANGGQRRFSEPNMNYKNNIRH